MRWRALPFLILSACALAAPIGPASDSAAPTLGDAVTLFAAGDIAACDEDGDERTASLLDSLFEQKPKAKLLLLGDNVYPSGRFETYQDCYAPSWGRFLSRTWATVGNHDYHQGSLGGYMRFFGQAAGDNPKGFYSRDLGAWRVVVLNSNCVYVACDAGSEQLRWLEQTLKTSPKCTLAVWHHPRFSSGLHGNNPEMQAIWALLAQAGVELVLSGHDHSFERFAPMDASGRLDARGGLRQFVVGTGGKARYPQLLIKANSQVRNNSSFGLLELRLYANAYAWKFQAVAGESFSDAGSTACH